MTFAKTFGQRHVLRFLSSHIDLSGCRIIGEGDSICEISHELVLDNWQSVPHTIPQECPFRRQIIRQRRKAVRRR